MNDFRKLAIPKKERLEVQLTDGTEEHDILYIITSLATIKGAEIFKNFRFVFCRLRRGAQLIREARRRSLL